MADYVGGTDRLFFDIGRTRAEAMRQAQNDAQTMMYQKMQLDEANRQFNTKQSLDYAKFQLEQDPTTPENMLKQKQAYYYQQKANDVIVSDPIKPTLMNSGNGIFAIKQNSDGTLTSNLIDGTAPAGKATSQKPKEVYATVDGKNFYDEISYGNYLVSKKMAKKVVTK